MSRAKWLVGVFAFELATANGGLAQTQGHTIANITAMPDQTIQLKLAGNAPTIFRSYFDIYLLDGSNDLLTWARLPSLLRTNSSTARLLYVDTTGLGPKFYRTISNCFPTPLPKPTGKYVVGTTSLLLTDSSRANRYNNPTNSSFMITLWFPARATIGHFPPPYLESKAAPAFAGLYGVSQTVLTGLFGQASGESEIATDEAPYPIVIYSHGFKVGRRDNTAKCEELASHGYVVVAIDHADCLATVFSNGQLLSTTLSSFSGNLFTNDVLDVRFVLQTLTELNQSDPLFANTLDLNRVGTMGWSYGGGVAAEVCRTDDRVLASVLLDAYLQNADNVIRLGLQKPFLGMYSVSGGGTQAPFYLATHDAYWMQISGTQHQHFADWLAWISSPTSNGRQAAIAMNACMLSFFEKYLKGIDDHLLDNPTNAYPQVINFVRK